MLKSLFAVVLTEGQEAGATRLRDAYSEAELYPLGDNVFIVAKRRAQQRGGESCWLDQRAGVGGHSWCSVVFKLNGSYMGYTRQSLWEWLENVEAAE